jgi:hypothetical protein
MGEMIGICRQSVSEIENKHVLARDSTWQRLCEYQEIRELSDRTESLPKDYWRNCLLEVTLAEKGDTFPVSPLRRRIS